MTVAGLSNKSGPFRGNGSLRDWPIDFDISASVQESEIIGYLVNSDGVSVPIESNFEVDLNERSYTYPTVASGQPPISSSYQVLIVRNLSLVQESDYKNQGPFPAETIEADFDRIVMILQQFQEQLNRSAKSDISGSEQDSEIAALLQEIAGARDIAVDASESASASATLASSASTSAVTSADNAHASANSAATYADASRASALSAATYADNARASAISAASSVAVGDPITRAEDISYLADTSGTVEYWATIDTGDQIVLYTDASNPPTTIRQQLTSNTGSIRMTMHALIKKGNYYKIGVLSGSPSPGGYVFVPLGT